MANYGRSVEIAETLLGRMTTLLNPFWGMLPRRLWRATKDYFVYSTTVEPLAAGQAVTNQIQIQADSHFMIIQINRDVRGANEDTIVANPAFTIQLFDSGSGRNLFDQAQHVENVVGTGQLPGYSSFPKILKASSTLSVLFTSLSANNQTVRLSFVGFKIFLNMPVGEW